MRVRAVAMLVLFLLAVSPVSAAEYTVRPGDNLTTIARRFHTSISWLMQANHLRNANLIRLGADLVVPDSTSAGTGAFLYRVRWGDTLSGISTRFGIPMASIRALNSLGRYLIAGSWLRLCHGCATGAAPPITPAPASTTSGTTTQYTVRPGDSLLSLAARFGVSTSALMAANGITNPDRIFIGSILTLPSGANAQPATIEPATTPSDPSATQSLITYWAQIYGISPVLPLALAWDESGFNQTLVSATGAIGVMQVEPATGVEIERQLGRSLSLYNLNDNVQAGVYWLSRLVSYYGGDPRMAVAAYYEGTPNIARYGLFSDTEQYVATVMSLESRFGG